MCLEIFCILSEKSNFKKRHDRKYHEGKPQRTHDAGVRANPFTMVKSNSYARGSTSAQSLWFPTNSQCVDTPNEPSSSNTGSKCLNEPSTSYIDVECLIEPSLSNTDVEFLNETSSLGIDVECLTEPSLSNTDVEFLNEPSKSNIDVECLTDRSLSNTRMLDTGPKICSLDRSHYFQQ